MERQRIVEILETYRPGEGLESDPEVRQALELAAQDPELSQLRRQIEEFDDIFAAKLQQVEAPSGLQEAILAAAGQRNVNVSEAPSPADHNPESRKIIQWFYPASFAAAAAIIILLALSFTYWNPPARPDQSAPALAGVGTGVLETAESLYASLRPSYRPDRGEDVIAYLRSNGGAVPVSLPGGVAFDQSFACDVVEVNGNKVSIICFMAPDNSRTMHLFTFKRSAFPNCKVPAKPAIQKDGKSCCAAWEDPDQDQVHVLYSDKGEQNLRQILDI
ncbi:MAG: hypothetical protein AB3N33_07410 [Puniceicoccaceae bacterium]